MLNRQAQRTEVTQLPPTTGIQDPIVRGFLDALSTAWATRSGFIDKDHPDGFVTRGEVGNLANQAVIDIFSGGVIGGAQAGANNFASSAHAAQVNGIIDNLADSIRKSILSQLLEEDILDVSSITQVVTTTGADISAEVVARSGADTALARAINNIWANIGGASAVIEDGGLAASGASSAAATNWAAIVAAVTDPTSGLIVSDAGVTTPVGATATPAVTLTGTNQTLVTAPALSPGTGVPVLLAISVAAAATYTGGSPGPLNAVVEIKRGATVVHSWPVDFPGIVASGSNWINIATNVIDTPGGSATYTVEARTTGGTGSALVSAATISAVALKR